MSAYTLTLEAQPAQTDIATINQWLVDYNLAQVGDHWKGRLTILARDHQRQLSGGIYGFTDRGWLRIEVLVVQEQLRHLGIGTQLVCAAEAEAYRRGCHSAWLDTFSFQALSFYERHGYTIFGALDQYPDTHTRYFLRKSLTVPAEQ
jgi:GNAT superfamily N-acetyltransferase